MLDSNALFLASELPVAPDLRALGEHLPHSWIEQALAGTSSASIRRRRLPAEQVVWLVIALALFRHRSIRQVVAELDLAMPDAVDRCVTDSAVTQARQRLGENPLAWLFETSALGWQRHDAARYDFAGLSLLAMDGTSLKLADSVANREHFGAPRFANDSVASYPHARMVSLSVLSTQLVLAARFGPYSTGEMTYAKQIVEQIPDRSLTIFDRAFLAAELLLQLCKNGSERHFLVPAKANTKWTLVDGDDADGTVEMTVSPAARKKDPSLPKLWRARAIRGEDPEGRPNYVLTSLTDRRKYPAARVRACYSRRWQIESSYRELKQTMMGMAVSLRSHTVEATRQEIWGCLIAYNLVRYEMARAAEAAKCAPTEISFILALHNFQLEMLHAASMQSQGNLPGLLKRMRERIITELNVYRPDRKFDRVVKAKPQRYPERRLKKP